MRHDELAHYGIKGMRWRHRKMQLKQLANDNSKLGDTGEKFKKKKLPKGVQNYVDRQYKRAEKMVVDVYQKRREQMKYPGLQSSVGNAKKTAATTAFKTTTKKYMEGVKNSKKKNAEKAKAIFDNATENYKKSLAVASGKRKIEKVNAQKAKAMFDNTTENVKNSLKNKKKTTLKEDVIYETVLREPSVKDKLKKKKKR